MKLKKEIVIHTLSYLLYIEEEEEENKQTLEKKMNTRKRVLAFIPSLCLFVFFLSLNFPLTMSELY